MRQFIIGMGLGFKWVRIANSIAWKNFGPFGYKLLLGKNRHENNMKFVDMFIDEVKKIEA